MVRKLHVCNNMFNHFCTSRHVSLTFKDATDPSDCLKGKTTKEARLRLWHNLGLILKKVSGSLIYYQYFEHLYFHKIFGYIINYCTLIFENVFCLLLFVTFVVIVVIIIIAVFMVVTTTIIFIFLLLQFLFIIIIAVSIVIYIFIIAIVIITTVTVTCTIFISICIIIFIFHSYNYFCHFIIKVIFFIIIMVTTIISIIIIIFIVIIILLFLCNYFVTASITAYFYYQCYHVNCRFFILVLLFSVFC